MPVRSALGISALVLLSACAREIPTASPCARVTIELHRSLLPPPGLDILFMVDNSGSMTEEQASLAAALPRMVRIVATGDFDQDGDVFGDGELNDVDFEPPWSLHVGVVTSDMGTAGFVTPACDRPDFGDDGILRTQGRTAIPGCMASYPSFLSFQPFGGDPTAFAQEVACVATVGTVRCGFGQPLEAILKALSPSAPTSWTADMYEAPTFFRNTFGHGDTNNDGFIRGSSVLAIIPVTDAEDCSVRDPELFNPSSTTYGATDRDLRCWAHSGALHDVRRYVEGLLQLRRRPGQLVYAPIVGIPVDLTPAPGESPAWDELICDDPATCDPRMLQEPDPADPTRLRPSCDVPGRGLAFPPTRMLRVARDLEARGAIVTVRSICQESLDLALSEIIREASAYGELSLCLPRSFTRGADGSIPCEIRGVLPEGTECTDVTGATPVLADGVAVFELDRALCTFRQLVPADRSPGAPAPAEAGWFYDDFTRRGAAGCGEADGFPWRRVAFTMQAPASLRLICLVPVVLGGGGAVGVGTPCNPSGDWPCELGLSPGGGAITCDALSGTCGVACTHDSDCRDAGLTGFVCDRHPLSELDPRFEDVTDPRDMCVSPTCS